MNVIRRLEMSDYIAACSKAYEYFHKVLNIEGLSTATENEDSWFFSGGKNSHEAIGNIIISVNKKTEMITVVDALSDEGYETIKKSVVIDIPTEYKVQ